MASAEAPRASCQARRLARLDLTFAPKRRERAAGQGAVPVSIRTIRRSDTRVSRRARCRTRLNLDDPPKRHERAARQDAGLVSSNYQLKRHTSELSGKPPGPPRTNAKATRASCWAICRARLEPFAEAIHERAVGQDAGPISIQTIRRSATSEPSGNTPGPSRSQPSAEAIHERYVKQAVAAEPHAIRHSSRSQRALQILNRTP